LINRSMMYHLILFILDGVIFSKPNILYFAAIPLTHEFA
jgi:hypothetical protein